MSARLDAARAALRLTDDELGAAVMLVAVPDHPSLSEPGSRASIESLTQAGIVSDGRIEGFPARLLSVVAAPKLRVSVESFVAVEPVVEQAWATEREGVWGVVAADGLIELTPIEPGLIPWAVARAVGLGPREKPDSPVLQAPAHVLGAAAERLADGEAADALAELEPDVRERLLAILSERRLSWRATSVWSDREEQHVTSVAVLDAGVEGLWLTRHEGEPPDTIVHLEPVAPSEVWERVVSLMP